MSDQMREEFGAWCESNLDPLWTPADLLFAKGVALQAWQASRAALCVELPKKFLFEGEDGGSARCIESQEGDWLSLEDTVEAITKTGVRVK